MKKFSIYLVAFVVLACFKTDPEPTIYFPPKDSSEWETIDPSELGWDTDEIATLDQFLIDTDTRALLVLVDGRIAIEKYAGKELVNTANDFTVSSNWYWASAGKTLTAALVGIAEDKALLSFDARSSLYLGSGWTSLTDAEEKQITVRHQLSMTTGLDDGVDNPDCTDPACLTFKAKPGTRWAYHNAPYTLLDGVISGATGKSINTFHTDELKSKIGMDGQYIMTGDNNVYYSTPRSMARFGLLLLNKGKWSDLQVIPESYINLMISSSQNYNRSYGYLTWLNSQPTYMVPGSQLVLTGPLSPNAPSDMFAAMGKNGQLINIAPEDKVVVVRVGDAPDTNLVPFTFQNDLWEKLNAIMHPGS